MSIKAVEAALNHYPHGGSKKLVLIAIAEQANTKTGVCWPSVETIASRSCASVRSVIYAIKELEEEGIIEVRRHRGRAGKKTSNAYRVRVDLIQKMPSLLFEDYGNVEDMFPPLPVDNPVGNKGTSQQLGANDTHDLRAETAPKPCLTVKRTSNRAGGNVDNLVDELSKKMAMTND